MPAPRPLMAAEFEPEDSTTLQLTLITLAEEEIQLPINFRERNRPDELEDAVVNCLPTISQLPRFGVSLISSIRARKSLYGTPYGHSSLLRAI